MKTLYLSIILIVLAVSLIPIFAQNETTPTIWFDQPSYATKEMSCYFYDTGKISGQDQKIATITITDQAANKYSGSIDRVTVYVWSDSDRKGIQVTAYETEVNSGIFKGTVIITEGQSVQNLIHVRYGDTITAKYTGATPESIDTQNQGITTTAFIGVSCPPLERVPASGINITDNEGNQEKAILVNKQIQIGSKLDNITIRNQTFAFIVQISDEHQNVTSLSSVSGLLLPSQTFSPSISWTPPSAGKYTVNIFVWQSINNPNSLSPPLLSEITVLPNVSTATSFENTKCQMDYELVIKPGNHVHVCVTPETAQKLIERGWGKETISNLHDDKNSTPDLSVASIKMIPPYTPGGPIIQLTLENVGKKPITSVKAVLELDNNYTFYFTNITSTFPLAPNNYATNSTMLIGSGFQTEVGYPLVISGMEGDTPFAYIKKVQIQG
jgi:hypothetical protein